MELLQVTQLVWTVAGFQPGVSESKICALNRCLLLPGVGRGLNPILGCCFSKPNLQTLFSLKPALHFPGLGLLTVSLSGPPVPVPAYCQRLCIYRMRSPVGFCSHLAAIWAWSPLAAAAAVPQVTPVLVGWAGPCAWQLAGPLSCTPAAALQTVPISYWFALILFRPESDACWRQKMWATSILELSDLPVCELCLLTVSGQRKASAGGESTIWVTKPDLEESGLLGCLLSDLCLYGLDIWDVWDSVDLGGHLFPKLHCADGET